MLVTGSKNLKYVCKINHKQWEEDEGGSVFKKKNIFFFSFCDPSLIKKECAYSKGFHFWKEPQKFRQRK